MLTPGKDYNYIAQCHHITPVENKTPYYFAIKIADEYFFTKETNFRELKQGEAVYLTSSFALVKTHMDPSTFSVVKIDAIRLVNEQNVFKKLKRKLTRSLKHIKRKHFLILWLSLMKK